VLLLAIAAGWLAVGLVAVVVMRRRGHDTFAWAILFLSLGPLALPLAVSSDRHPPPQPNAPPHDGRLDVLVTHDGSANATAALHAALNLLGTQVTSLTLAAVVDLEAASTVRGRGTQRETQARLGDLARDVATVTTAPVDTVILFGKPTVALQRFAAEQGYELIVVAERYAESSRLIRRRAARKPGSASPVPVLIATASP
jgi:nucleotide-binding universal stress UspA family protein